MVYWLELCAFTAKGIGLIPGQGTKIPVSSVVWSKKKKKKKNLRVLSTQRLCVLCKVGCTASKKAL